MIIKLVLVISKLPLKFQIFISGLLKMIIDRIFPTKPNIPTDGIRTPRKTLVNVEPLLLVIFDTSLEPKNPHVLSHWSFEFDVFTSLDIVVNAPMSDAKEEKNTDETICFFDQNFFNI